MIGAGTIGSAIIRGVLDAGLGWSVVATGRKASTLRRIRRLGARVAESNRAAVEEADIAVLAVKPHQLPGVVEEIRGAAWGKVVVSVAAAVPLSWLAERLPGAHLVRAMPNINVVSRTSFTALAAEGVPRRARRLVEALFGALGVYEWVDERHMDALTALSGSGPAFLAEVLDALTLGGVAAGLPRELARKAALYTMLGTARTLLGNGMHPAELRDAVTTPAGTTIKGIMAIQALGAKKALIDAVLEATRRAAELRGAVEAPRA